MPDEQVEMRLFEPEEPAAGRAGAARWRGRRRRTWALAVLGVTGALLTACGAALALCWEDAFRLLLHRELSLSPSSSSYRVWKDTPVPLTLEFFFFNWTNPEQLREPDSRPQLREMGPYVFREVHEKTDVQWNSNSTVSFRRVRRWFFDPQRSNGSLDDAVTTLNVVALTAAFHTRHWSYFMQKSLSMSLATLGQRVHATHTVRQLLFEGYSSPLISMAKSMPALAGVNIPYDRFGWFYQRNGTAEHDGLFTMHTGAADLARLGELTRWNGAASTAFFPDSCGRVNGSAGELWPPGRRRAEPLAMFSPDLCRSISLDFEEESEVEGVAGLRYGGGAALLSGDEAGCFCGGECPPAGLLNVSSCRLGAPAFVSYPHFFRGDPALRRRVRGLRPERDRHRFYLTVEPTTGIPLDVAARFQINILLQPQEYIGMLEGVPRIYFPMLWFQERAVLTADLAHSLRLLLALPGAARAATATLLLLGPLLLLVLLLLLTTQLGWMRAPKHTYKTHHKQERNKIRGN